MKAIKQIMNGLARLHLVIALSMLTVMVIVIIYQVFSRQILSSTPSWTEELSRILFIWVGFLGIAYGFKEKLHIGVGLLVGMFPEAIQDLFDYIAKVLIIMLGVVMVYYGWEFTVLMSNSTLPGTKLPSSVLYASIPVSGFFIFIYAIELLFKKRLASNYDDVTEE